MYIKRLEIQGFKSFADKVELELNAGITVVVGPNGSGKSNVVDAIRWVLGEQSAKTLRGLRMDDIIFSGSSNRRPLGMAQVSLTLDNSLGIVPLDYSEITVSRRLYRSGESEYLINKVPCRMKDVHQLFMDTGVGREGFSVIGQGKIDEILSLKAEDRRSLIEEAAGIVKYRYRKKETERKLQDTQQSLLRINDIVLELSEQLEPLAQQAKDAGQYQTWKKELEQWEINIALQDITENEVKEKELNILLVNLEDNLTEADTKYLKFASQLEEQRFKNQELDQHLSRLQQEFYDLNSELEKKEHQRELSWERTQGILTQQQRINQELDHYSQQKKALDWDVQEKKSYLEKLNLDYEEALFAVQELSSSINQQKNILNNKNILLEEHKSQIIQVLHEKSQLKNEISKLDNGIQLLKRRHEIIEDKIIQIRVDLDDLQKKDKSLKEKGEVLLNNQKATKDKLDQMEKDLINNTLTHSKIKKVLEQKQFSYQQTLSRLEVLKEMEVTGEGYQQGVKSIWEARNKKNINLTGIIGTVADIVTVPKNLELALETALGGSLQYIITEDDQSAQVAVKYLKSEKKGRATFLPLNTIKGAKQNLKLDFPSIVGRAVDLIKFETKYQGIMEHLLGRVWVIENLEDLVQIGKKTNFSHRMVTLDGDIITPGGALTGGSYRNQKTGLLTRKRLLKELEDEVILKAHEIELTKEQLQEKEQNIQLLQVEIVSQRDILHENQLALADQDNKRERILEEIMRIDQEKASYKLEQEEVQLQCDQDEEEKTAFLRELTTKETKIMDLEKETGFFQENIEALALAQEMLVEDLNEKKIKTATLEQARMLGQEQVMSLEKDLLNLDQNKKKLELEKEQLAEKVVELDEDRKNLEIVGKEFTNKIANLAEEIKTEKDKRIKWQELVDFLEKEIKTKQQKIEGLKNEIHQNKLKLSKVEMEICTNREKLIEKFGSNYLDALDCKLDIQNRRNVFKRINELKESIAELGLVNFAAISEHERVSQRLTFLSNQLNDLNEARESLLKVITDLDQIMVKKFKDTFSQINGAFNLVFTEIFGGGSAALELSDAGNLLETGIEIIAQPPGKKPQTLSLLSGGERAMTAIALLFAILKVKPSPFCVLDEIEAALDEANVDRFSAFLKQFVDQTQFIIISHRKGTMEVADILYGVTIEEQTGISKLISVKLSEAV